MKIGRFKKEKVEIEVSDYQIQGIVVAELLNLIGIHFTHDCSYSKPSVNYAIDNGNLYEYVDGRHDIEEIFVRKATDMDIQVLNIINSYLITKNR